jgi:hypothetical protein
LSNIATARLESQQLFFDEQVRKILMEQSIQRVRIKEKFEEVRDDVALVFAFGFGVWQFGKKGGFAV